MKTEWMTFGEVRDKYEIRYSQLLSMRLARFTGTFPTRRTGKMRTKITQMRVTPELDHYLRQLNQKQEREEKHEHKRRENRDNKHAQPPHH